MISYVQCVPAPRPRLGRHGTFYIPARYRECRDQIAMDWRREGRPLLTGAVRVSVRFVNPGRGDIDNLIKTVLDALRLGRAFEDDCQVKQLRAEIIADPGRQPMVEIEVEPAGGRLL